MPDKYEPSPQQLNKHISGETEKPEDEQYINPYYNFKMLTRKEVIDLINHLSGALLANEYKR